MKQYHIVWKGVQPLILHSCQTVNPLHPVTKAMKAITSKGTKKMTEEDHARISDLEMIGGVYSTETDYSGLVNNFAAFADKDVGLHIPAENIEATIRDAAKSQRKGKDITRFLNVVSPINPLDIGEDLTWGKLMDDFRFRDVRQMKTGGMSKGRVTRTRGRFNTWALGFDVIVDEKNLDPSFLEEIMNYAGQYVGLCDSRPKYGKFVVAEISEVALDIPA